jgi:hypothetical protein
MVIGCSMRAMWPNDESWAIADSRLTRDSGTDSAQRRLGALLGITHQIIRVIHGLSGGRLSPRKLIPVNLKTTGDYLLLKRIEANLSQPEVALKAGVSEAPPQLEILPESKHRAAAKNGTNQNRHTISSSPLMPLTDRPGCTRRWNNRSRARIVPGSQWRAS